VTTITEWYCAERAVVNKSSIQRRTQPRERCINGLSRQLWQ
jgi:hypothetical protein